MQMEFAAPLAQAAPASEPVTPAAEEPPAPQLEQSAPPPPTPELEPAPVAAVPAPDPVSAPAPAPQLGDPYTSRAAADPEAGVSRSVGSQARARTAFSSRHGAGCGARRHPVGTGNADTGRRTVRRGSPHRADRRRLDACGRRLARGPQDLPRGSPGARRGRPSGRPLHHGSVRTGNRRGGGSRFGFRGAGPRGVDDAEGCQAATAARGNAAADDNRDGANPVRSGTLNFAPPCGAASACYCLTEGVGSATSDGSPFRERDAGPYARDQMNAVDPFGSRAPDRSPEACWHPPASPVRRRPAAAAPDRARPIRNGMPIGSSKLLPAPKVAAEIALCARFCTWIER